MGTIKKMHKPQLTYKVC